MFAPTKLWLTPNNFDGCWDVLDAGDFCFGEGETPEDAIASARGRGFNAPIETYWGTVPANETSLPEVGE